MRAEGVEYFSNDLIPGRDLFRCSRLSASLQVSSCAQMWEKSLPGDRCRGCPVGAQHAGRADSTASPLRGIEICARCHRQGMRLIGGNVCVSCKNREYEWVKGKNARGKAPVSHPVLERRRVCVRRGDRVVCVDRALSASTLELVVEVLRDSSTQAVFGLGKGRAYAGK